MYENVYFSDESFWRMKIYIVNTENVLLCNDRLQKDQFVCKYLRALRKYWVAQGLEFENCKDQDGKIC